MITDFSISYEFKTIDGLRKNFAKLFATHANLTKTKISKINKCYLCLRQLSTIQVGANETFTKES